LKKKKTTPNQPRKKGVYEGVKRLRGGSRKRKDEAYGAGIQKGQAYGLANGLKGRLHSRKRERDLGLVSGGKKGMLQNKEDPMLDLMLAEPLKGNLLGEQRGGKGRRSGHTMRGPSLGLGGFCQDGYGKLQVNT